LTWGIGAAAVLAASASREAGGMDVLYIGYNLDMAREFIDTCAMWAKAFHHASSTVQEFVFKDREPDGGERDIQAFRIIFASGHEACALSSHPRSLRGRQGMVIIDEAAFHDDLDELLKAALALLIWGGKVVVISTHDGEDNPFNLQIEEVKKGRKPYGLLKIDFDQALRDGLYKRICLVTGKTWSPEAEAKWRQGILDLYGEHADEELFVIPGRGSGTYIPPALIQRQQRDGIPVVRWECNSAFGLLPEDTREAETRRFCESQLAPLLATLDPDLPTYFGEDFARKGDLTTLWPAQRQRDMRLRPPFIVELRNVPYENQKQVLFFVLDGMIYFLAAAMDATGNGGYLAEVAAQRYGQRVQQVAITPGFYTDIMPKWKAAFEDDRTLLPADLDVYNDHRTIKTVRGVPQIVREAKGKGKGEDAKKAQKQRHGDTAVSHLMCFYASLMEIEEYAYEPAVSAAADPGQPGHDDDDDDLDGRARFGQGAW
jgi:phage FluMu gp28-like protein